MHFCKNCRHHVGYEPHLYCSNVTLSDDGFGDDKLRILSGNLSSALTYRTEELCHGYEESAKPTNFTEFAINTFMAVFAIGSILILILMGLNILAAE